MPRWLLLSVIFHSNKFTKTELCVFTVWIYLPYYFANSDQKKHNQARRTQSYCFWVRIGTFLHHTKIKNKIVSFLLQLTALVIFFVQDYHQIPILLSSSSFFSPRTSTRFLLCGWFLELETISIVQLRPKLLTSGVKLTLEFLCASNLHPSQIVVIVTATQSKLVTSASIALEFTGNYNCLLKNDKI